MQTLKTPRTGRSRFSKALPAPPPLERTLDSPRSAATSTKKELPAVPPPPPKEDMFSKPLDSPLPPIPLRTPLVTGTGPNSPASAHIGMSFLSSDASNASGAPRAPAAMSIPRRPVAKQEPPAPAEPSPTGSLLSLLSAYSRSSGESLIRSSDGDASTKSSEPTLSPTQEDSDGLKRDMLTALAVGSFLQRAEEGKAQDGSRHQVVKEDTPPPPAKDGASPGTPPRLGSEVTAPLATSPPRPQIWRRRSVKAEQNINVSDLKLTASHGSTADSQLSRPAYSPFHSNQNSPARPLQPPFTTLGLPGRNIRPAASRDNLTRQPSVAEDMGQKVSKLKAKIHANSADKETPRFTSASETALPQPPKRLPTPDYQKEDVKTPILDTVVSPVSPASSPEPGKEEQPKQEAKQQVASRIPAPPRRDLHSARSLPELKVSTGAHTSKEAVPPVPRDFAYEQPDAQPRNAQAGAAASRDQQPDQTARSQFPPRSSSVRSGLGGPRRGVGIGQYPAPGSSLENRPGPHGRRPEGPQGTYFMEHVPQIQRGRKDSVAAPTVYREMREEDLPPADARATYFPIQTTEPAPAGTVFKPVPLKVSHHNCYQRHQNMRVTPNRHYSLACQTCHREDAETRWQCSWCSLRICEACTRVLQSYSNDLTRLLEHIESHPPSAVSVASSRPPSRQGSDGFLATVEEAAE